MLEIPLSRKSPWPWLAVRQSARGAAIALVVVAFSTVVGACGSGSTNPRSSDTSASAAPSPVGNWTLVQSGTYLGIPWSQYQAPSTDPASSCQAIDFAGKPSGQAVTPADLARYGYKGKLLSCAPRPGTHSAQEPVEPTWGQTQATPTAPSYIAGSVAPAVATITPSDSSGSTLPVVRTGTSIIVFSQQRIDSFDVQLAHRRLHCPIDWTPGVPTSTCSTVG